MTVRSVTMLTNAVAPDKLGGLERYVRELAAGLVARGVEVTVITKQVDTQHPLREVGEDGVQVVRHRVPSKKNPLFAGLYPVAVERGVRHATRGSAQSILHGHFCVPIIPLALRRKPFAYTFHAPVYRELLSERQGSYVLPRVAQRAVVGAVKRAERAVVSTASPLIVLSEFSREELARLNPRVAQDALLIPGGIDTDWFAPSANDVGRALVRDSARPLIFAARRMTPRTGVLELVEAMPTVLAGAPGARLVLAGDGASRPRIEQEVARLRLGHAITLLGRVPEAELVDWYRKATFTVVPTQELEGFGLSTAESLAVGTPALVTPVGANPEVAGPLDEALVVSGRSPEDIAAGMLRLIRQPSLLTRIRGDARRRVHPAFSWSTVVERHLELYDELSWRRSRE